jgi:hypothetical protein
VTPAVGREGPGATQPRFRPNVRFGAKRTFKSLRYLLNQAGWTIPQNFPENQKPV